MTLKAVCYEYAIFRHFQSDSGNNGCSLDAESWRLWIWLAVVLGLSLSKSDTGSATANQIRAGSTESIVASLQAHPTSHTIYQFSLAGLLQLFYLLSLRVWKTDLSFVELVGLLPQLSGHYDFYAHLSPYWHRYFGRFRKDVKYEVCITYNMCT